MNGLLLVIDFLGQTLAQKDAEIASLNQDKRALEERISALEVIAGSSSS